MILVLNVSSGWIQLGMNQLINHTDTENLKLKYKGKFVYPTKFIRIESKGWLQFQIGLVINFQEQDTI